jgi:ArsR family transcriptional regulator, arsenate/arsenite/antimonite-responsive transcriptional repressor
MDMFRALSAFGALGQPTRLAVFQLLVTVEPEGLAAGDIARRLDLRANTPSTHLGILQAAGMIAAVRDGRSIHYSVNPAGLRGLLIWLMQDCCGGAPETCAPVLDRIVCAC